MPPSSLKARLRRLPGYGVLRLCYRLARDRDSRGVALLRLRRPDNLFQPYGTTSADRYPRLFRIVRDRLGDGAQRRILSFGCSTGDEVFSLRRYFPTAEIKGIDINPRGIAACRARLAGQGGDSRLSFSVAASATDEAAESYDAVFAMAVFRHGDLNDGPARCDGLIHFADFDRTVGALARCLKPGGLLVLRHANFRFADTGAAAGFERIFIVGCAPGRRDQPLYGPDDRLMPDAVADDGIYQKRGTGSERAPWTMGAIDVVSCAPVEPQVAVAPPPPPRLLAEAALALVAARLLTLLPFRLMLPLAGFRQPPTPPPSDPDDSAAQPDLVAMGAAIARVAGAAPFRAVCLQMAVAAALMLRRRGLPVELHLGVGRADSQLTAHAWTVCRGTVVTGAQGRAGLRRLATFIAGKPDR